MLFIGGSVTQGAWASPGNSYTEQVSRWLGTKFNTVATKNIAVGGTDSEFGVYRLEQDIGVFRPDIAFIEYAVNDKPTKVAVQENVDGLIFKLRRINPDVVIIFIGATYPAEETLRRAGSRDPRAIYAQDIVEQNGGIFVDAGFLLWHHINLTGRNPQDFFTDFVHPNDLGHESYFFSIQQALTDRIATVKGLGSASSIYASRTNLGSARLIDPSAVLTASTCAVSADAGRLEFVGQAPSYYDREVNCARGNSFTANFNGTSIGITGLNTVGGGTISCALDGGSRVSIASNDYYAHAAPQLIFRNQADGPHSMVCEADGPISFGDFLISSARASGISG